MTWKHAFSPGLEFAAPEKIYKRQLALLKNHVQYLSRNSRFYRKIFTDSGLDQESIAQLDDLRKFPITSKSDLEGYTQDFLCVAEEEVADLCLTSGTTGHPAALKQTRGDLDRLGFNEETAFGATGIHKTDKVLIAAAMDRCFMAGLAYYMGLLRIGAATIRAGSSSIPVLMDLVQSHRPTAMVGVPTLMLTVAQRLAEEGEDPRSLGMQRLVCIGEPVRNQDFTLSPLGKRLEEFWGAKIFGTYASTEMATTFCECEQGNGGHFHPELIVVEILNINGEPVKQGEPGEVVITPLQVAGMPLLRFRTGDMAVLHTDPCPCGRSTPRLSPILGRKCQLLKIKGTTVYPQAIFAVLQEIPEVVNFYIEVTGRFALSDHVRVVAGTRAPGLTSLMVAERIASRIRIKPEVVLTDPEAVQTRTMVQGKRKPATFFDLREELYE